MHPRAGCSSLLGFSVTSSHDAPQKWLRLSAGQGVPVTPSHDPPPELHESQCQPTCPCSMKPGPTLELAASQCWTRGSRYTHPQPTPEPAASPPQLLPPHWHPRHLGSLPVCSGGSHPPPCWALHTLGHRPGFLPPPRPLAQEPLAPATWWPRPAPAGHRALDAWVLWRGALDARVLSGL